MLLARHPVERVVEREPVPFQAVSEQRSVAVRAPVAFVGLKPVDRGFAAGGPQ